MCKLNGEKQPFLVASHNFYAERLIHYAPKYLKPSKKILTLREGKVIISVSWFNRAYALKNYLQEGNTFMKKAKKLLVIACLGGVGYLLVKLLKMDLVQEKLFEILGEDTYLAILDKVRLLGDLLMWPIDFVRALLP